MNEHSAFMFEGMFARLKEGYKSGTPNIGKQSIQNMLLRTRHEHHVCERRPKFADHATSKLDDSLVYIYNSEGFSFFKVMEKKNEDLLLCHRVITRPLDDKLKWRLVGVFKVAFVDHDVVNLRTDNISGKAIECVGHILSVPTASLFEN